MCKDKIKQAFEDKIGEGGYGHLLYKNFGGQYADSHVASQWDGFRWGYEAALAALHTYDPATHVVVPREPTNEMLLAAWKSQYMHVGGDAQSSYILAKKRVDDEKQNKMDKEAYKAMISAAEVRD